jgi:hypothetical protein
MLAQIFLISNALREQSCFPTVISMTDTANNNDAFSIDDTETVIKSAIGSVLTDSSYKP